MNERQMFWMLVAIASVGLVIVALLARYGI